jgi:hypothetical protein
MIFNVKIYIKKLNEDEIYYLRIVNDKLKFNFIVEPFVNIPMRAIKEAAIINK